MSFLSGLPQLASILAQPAVLAAGVATGVAVGAVGVGTGVIPVTDPGPRLTPLYECPGSGRVVTSLQPDQKVLVTARNADGTWLELYIGQAGAERAWAPAKALQLRAAPDSLPVDDCTTMATAAPLPTTLEPPSVAPSESTGLPSGVPATVAPSPTTSPTPGPTKTPKPTKTPAPTPTPLTGPILSNLQIQDIPEDPYNPGQYPLYQLGCTTPGVYTSAPFLVHAEDPDGIGSVTLYYKPAGASVALSTDMGDEGGGDYYGYFSGDGNWNTGEVQYWVQAVDSLGNPGPILHGASNQKVIMTMCND